MHIRKNHAMHNTGVYTQVMGNLKTTTKTLLPNDKFSPINDC